MGDANAASSMVCAPSNQVFVAGISSSCTEHDIRSAFSRYGVVEDIKIRGEIKPYCFVTYHDISSAKRAVEGHSVLTASPFEDVAFAKPRKKHTPKNKPSDRSLMRVREDEEICRIKAFCGEANLIVQVESSHIDRFEAYLHRSNNGADDTCRILGSTQQAGNSKSASLLFLSCDTSIEMARNLYTNPLLARAIKKVYVVQPGMLEGNIASGQGCAILAKLLVANLRLPPHNDGSPAILRLQTFPPKHQRNLLISFDAIIQDDDEISQRLAISPRGFTHLLSVVEVYRNNGEDESMYMFGTTPASGELDVVDNNKLASDECSLNRAYHKLKEGIVRYETSNSGFIDNLQGSIALDCGSAPGGWTKFLIERFGCTAVYSIDPGKLSPSVLELKGTKHLKMRVQDAIPALLDDEAVSGKVKIWVSDMCLHSIDHQVDVLLEAKQKGLLAPSAFFVLTMKCIAGRSRQSYDAQVQRVVERLSTAANTSRVETYHLFANRSGERTVIGYMS